MRLENRKSVFVNVVIICFPPYVFHELLFKSKLYTVPIIKCCDFPCQITKSQIYNLVFVKHQHNNHNGYLVRETAKRSTFTISPTLKELCISRPGQIGIEINSANSTISKWNIYAKLYFHDKFGMAIFLFMPLTCITYIKISYLPTARFYCMLFLKKGNLRVTQFVTFI